MNEFVSYSEAREKGYVTTIYGRRRYVDLAHGQQHERAAAERQAVNSIVQVLTYTHLTAPCELLLLLHVVCYVGKRE